MLMTHSSLPCPHSGEPTRGGATLSQLFSPRASSSSSPLTSEARGRKTGGEEARKGIEDVQIEKGDFLFF